MGYSLVGDVFTLIYDNCYFYRHENHVLSMLALGVETINKQAATMACKIHKTQPQRA